MDDLLTRSISELSPQLKSLKVSPVAVTEACLARIAATEDRLHAYVRVFAGAARAAAGQAEAEISAGHWKGPLHGIPVAIKDLYDVAGVETTASSKVRAHWLRTSDSTAVARLRAAGAIILGKTQTHEFAYGVTTPTTRNPWDTRCVPGGSSGGSAATVASGGAFAAIGTDTGGSIRIPGSLCGVVGLKPTFGRVSRVGITSLSWGLDHAGPITRSVEDAALCLQAMAGYDADDPGSLDEPVPDLRAECAKGMAGLRVGIPRNYFFDRLRPPVAIAVRNGYQTLQALGATLVDVTIPMADQFVPVETLILMAEASTYHRRMLRETPKLYTDEVRAQLEAGMLIPAVDYLHAQRVRTLLQREVRELYRQIDVIVAPSVPAAAVPVETRSLRWDDGTEERVASAYTRLAMFADVLGLPTLTLPCGFTDGGLPIGMQIMGRPLDEATVVRASALYEHATDWHKRHPQL
ncbi:MAG TPA: amidase [Nevskiaceae bacterium]|nr:amidase [Nevskiaceae bacterium]